MNRPRVCIIGAGSSGIAAAKTLHERGLSFDCFERGSGIGGNWRFEDDSGHSSAYASLHVNTSRTKMAFADFPMPDDYPDFPHHAQVLAYFESYVDHFGFREALTFRTDVQHVQPRPDGCYDVTVRHLDSGIVRTETYGAVLVANGHHWDPHWPDFPGTLDGAVLHAHDYKRPDVFVGKHVLVVGVGNSGCDIVCEASKEAARTLLSTRRGAHVLPKYLVGRPLDHFATPLTSRFPSWLQQLTASALLLLTRGRQATYGFPKPDHPFDAAHPTISSDLLPLVRDGAITVKPNVERLAGDRVRFVDGTEERVEVVVYATGYNLSFPFFPEGFLQPEGNRLPLFLHAVPPGVPNLYFLGLLQPIGAVMPLAELQARWIADLLGGGAGLPPEEVMREAIRRQDQELRRRYVPSRRHTIEVDFFRYVRALKKEWRLGRARAPRQALTPAPSVQVPA